MLKIEGWWKGRAPWGYHQLTLLENAKWKDGKMVVTNTCGLEDKGTIVCTPVEIEPDGRLSRSVAIRESEGMEPSGPLDSR